MNKITSEDIDRWLDSSQQLMNELASIEEKQKVIKQPDVVEDTEWKKYYYSEGGNKTEYNRRRLPKNRYIRARYDAKRRSTGEKEFTITLEEYLEFIKKPCYYCNQDISNSSGSGMDRIDNKRGYSLDNVNQCCMDCNRRRGDTMSAEEFKTQSKLNGYWKENKNEANKS